MCELMFPVFVFGRFVNVNVILLSRLLSSSIGGVEIYNYGFYIHDASVEKSGTLSCNGVTANEPTNQETKLKLEKSKQKRTREIEDSKSTDFHISKLKKQN